MSVSPLAIRHRVSAASEHEVLQDGFLVIALSLIGLLGFRTTYGGTAYLLVGLIGLLLGIAISEIMRRLGQSVLAELAVTVVVFLLLGGAIAGSGGGLISAVPSPHTMGALFEIGRRGWKELLTTQPPVGNTQGLLAIPYIIGLIGGVSGFSLARRTRLVAVPALAPAVVLALGILFGTTHPAALFIQGSMFAGVSLGWMAMRTERNRTATDIGQRTHGRPMFGLLVIAVAALLAPVIAPLIPFGTSHQRVVLTRYVIPPFDANSLASPLGTFRRYTSPYPLASADLFTVKGLKANSLVRIATMDSYDGLSWGFGTATGGSPGSADAFYRYGSLMPAAYKGISGTVTVHTLRDFQAWLPDVGEVTGIHFSGSQASSLLRDFRYDPATGTAADPSAQAGQVTYRMNVVVSPKPAAPELGSAAPGTDHLDVSVPPALQTAANQWVGGALGAWTKVVKIADHLRLEGKFSNGDESVPLALAGHSAGRLTDFIDGTPIVGKQIVGDDEQYAATLALMSNAVGVPARVVLGAQVPANGIVQGRDIHAWVEVELSGLGWVTVDPSMFLPKATPAEVIPQTQQPIQTQAPVAPPTVSVLRPPLDSGLPQSAVPSKLLSHPKGSGFHIPGFLIATFEYVGIPALVLIAVGASIMGLKGRRRRRRREFGTAATRVAAGWRELLDHARDHGIPVPGSHTRREQARALPPGWEVSGLASTADAAIFGPGEPTTETVHDYWRAVDDVIVRLRSQATRWQRLKAAINPVSLYEGREVVQ